MWTVPKGEYGGDELPLAAALREFAEEVGHPAPVGDPLPLGEVTQKGGKRVLCWALEGDVDVTTARSNTFTMRWRGELREFPEVERVAWFAVDDARPRIMPAQEPYLDRLLAALAELPES